MLDRFVHWLLWSRGPGPVLMLISLGVTTILLGSLAMYGVLHLMGAL